MKNILTTILTILSLNLLGQNYDIYRVVAHSNEMHVHSISNTIKVPHEHAIFVPNVFSPDGDNTNDTFQVVGRGLDHITIEIYNRWGQMIFEAPNLNEVWDGTFRGKPCPIGTYVYQLKVDTRTSQSGTITLIR
jgi:gliding motility-associated-like protein|tara:strand:- start:142 stop:543 length:402 start_codon:yes stop_codon:yes gene_type:complete